MPQFPEALLSIPLVSRLSDEQRQRVLGVGHGTSLVKGEILFHEADPADAMYVVVEGTIKMIRYSPQGKEMLLHLVVPGQSFAEAALFGTATYPAAAQAVEASQLWCLPRARLLELIGGSPELGMAMVASVSHWTRTLVGKLELLTQRRVEERLAIYLLGRARGAVAAGDTIELSEPRHLIAAQIGTAPEVLSRTFRRLEEDGLLEVGGRRVTVLDPARLAELAEWLGD
jgi:CRP/FNR family transcriptional regulator